MVDWLAAGPRPPGDGLRSLMERAAAAYATGQWDAIQFELWNAEEVARVAEGMAAAYPSVPYYARGYCGGEHMHPLAERFYVRAKRAAAAVPQGGRG